MSTPDYSGEIPEQSRPKASRILGILAFLALCLFAGYTYLSAQRNQLASASKLSEQTAINTELLTQLSTLQTAMEDMKTAKVQEQQEQAISANNALAVLERGEVLRLEILQLAEQQRTVKAQIAELMESDTGRRIASDIALVEQVNAALAVSLPSPQLTESMLTRIESLLVAPQKAIEQQISGYTPGPSLEEAFTSLQAELTQARTILDRVSSDLNLISRKAQTLPQSSEHNLAEAVAALEEIKKQERSEIIARAKEDAKNKAAELLAAQEAENERLLAAAKLEASRLAGEKMAAQIIADAQAEKQRQEAALREKEAALAKAKLEEEFNRDLPAIRNYLTAFISDGYEMRGNNTGKGPVSLSALRGTRLFQAGRPGLEYIIYFASNQNDRPRGPIEPETGGDYGWKIADKDTLNKIQSLLSKYGELMVEKGLLAP